MSESKCQICKDTKEPKTDISKTGEELTTSDEEKETANEIYEPESEHEWDSDGEPDELADMVFKKYASVQALVGKSEEMGIVAASEEAGIQAVSEEKSIEPVSAVRVEENDITSAEGSEESHERIKRALPRTKKVKMPSGRDVYITTPSSRGWKCGRRTKLITLHRHGRMGKKEFDIVASELEKTKMDIPNCANRGGCLKSFKVLKIRKIQNGCLWQRYQERKREIQSEGKEVNELMLFHGTKNVWDVVGKGFDERFSSPNGVFGAGVYFADKSSASNEYTFGILGGTGCPVHNNKSCTICIRRMLLCRVTLGKIHDNGTTGTKYAHAPVGFHSVKGKNGPTNYTEYIIYRGEQAYPEYLISYTIKV